MAQPVINRYKAETSLREVVVNIVQDWLNFYSTLMKYELLDVPAQIPGRELMSYLTIQSHAFVKSARERLINETWTDSDMHLFHAVTNLMIKGSDWQEPIVVRHDLIRANTERPPLRDPLFVNQENTHNYRPNEVTLKKWYYVHIKCRQLYSALVNIENASQFANTECNQSLAAATVSAGLIVGFFALGGATCVTGVGVLVCAIIMMGVAAYLYRESCEDAKLANSELERCKKLLPEMNKVISQWEAALSHRDPQSFSEPVGAAEL